MTESPDRCACQCGGFQCASVAKVWTHGTRSAFLLARCRCDACRAFNLARVKRTQAETNSETRQSASRNRFVWTGPELEIATRPDLTAKQAAEMLGRTYWAVKTARRNCRKDPVFIRLLGAPRGEST